MKNNFRPIIIGSLLSVFILLSCSEKGPSRDEIPLIRTLLQNFEEAVREQNQARLDSMIVAEALQLGYSSEKILTDVYGSAGEGTFYTFGNKEFFYVVDKGVVNCFIKADSADPGRPVEITLVKAANTWLIKRFDLK